MEECKKKLFCPKIKQKKLKIQCIKIEMNKNGGFSVILLTIQSHFRHFLNGFHETVIPTFLFAMTVL